jgi:hypothetical protein
MLVIFSTKAFHTKFAYYYHCNSETRRFSTASTEVCHREPSWASSTYLPSSQPNSPKFTLIMSLYLLGFTSGPFPRDFPVNIECLCTSIMFHVRSSVMYLILFSEWRWYRSHLRVVHLFSDFSWSDLTLYMKISALFLRETYYFCFWVWWSRHKQKKRATEQTVNWVPLIDSQFI